MSSVLVSSLPPFDSTQLTPAISRHQANIIREAQRRTTEMSNTQMSIEQQGTVGAGTGAVSPSNQTNSIAQLQSTASPSHPTNERSPPANAHSSETKSTDPTPSNESISQSGVSEEDESDREETETPTNIDDHKNDDDNDEEPAKRQKRMASGKSKRVSHLHRHKAAWAVPMIRFEPEFVPPTLEQISRLLKQYKRKIVKVVRRQDSPTDNIPMKDEPLDTGIREEGDDDDEPETTKMKSETNEQPSNMDTSTDIVVKTEGKDGSVEAVTPMKDEPGMMDVDPPAALSPSSSAAADGEKAVSASASQSTVDDNESESDEDVVEDLFPDLVLPNKLIIRKLRLPKNTRKSLWSKKVRMAARIAKGLTPHPPKPGAKEVRLDENGEPIVVARPKRKRPPRVKKTRNEWSESEGSDESSEDGWRSQRMNASEWMLDQICDEDAALERDTQKAKRQRKEKVPSEPPPPPPEFTTDEEKKRWQLAHFAVYSDPEDDGYEPRAPRSRKSTEPNSSASLLEGDLPPSSEDEDGDGTAEIPPGMDPKEARKLDELARLKIHAQMELSERRAYDKLVQNEMNDSYAFCDSNPRTMVLSRDSLLIKLDLSDIINNEVLGFLSESQLAQLTAMLPECDRTPEGTQNTFISPMFLQSIYEYQELLMTGSLDPDMREMRNVVSARRRREMQDSWKNKNFERYWGEQYSYRYGSKPSEDNKMKPKTQSNIYWKPPAMKAEFQLRQQMEGLLIKCVAGDKFALRRRKMMLVKEKRWPLPTLRELKKQQAAGVAASNTPRPTPEQAAAAQAEAAARKAARVAKKDRVVDPNAQPAAPGAVPVSVGEPGPNGTPPPMIAGSIQPPDSHISSDSSDSEIALDDNDMDNLFGTDPNEPGLDADGKTKKRKRAPPGTAAVKKVKPPKDEIPGESKYMRLKRRKLEAAAAAAAAAAIANGEKPEDHAAAVLQAEQASMREREQQREERRKRKEESSRKSLEYSLGLLPNASSSMVVAAKPVTAESIPAAALPMMPMSAYQTMPPGYGFPPPTAGQPPLPPQPDGFFSLLSAAPSMPGRPYTQRELQMQMDAMTYHSAYLQQHLQRSGHASYIQSFMTPNTPQGAYNYQAYAPQHQPPASAYPIQSMQEPMPQRSVQQQSYSHAAIAAAAAAANSAQSSLQG